MKQLTATAIILSRTNYGEADRILTLLTAEHGKISAIAKGVRREKSKLAGGIELFSTSDITFIQGRSGLDTLVSARLIVHYGKIAADLQRSMFAYDALKRVNKITEENTGPEYFTLLQRTLTALNDAAIGLPLIELWFTLSLLSVQGSLPNLQTDASGSALLADAHYQFDLEAMSFMERPHGPFGASHIKFLRLAAVNQPAVLQKISGANQLTSELQPLVRLLQAH